MTFNFKIKQITLDTSYACFIDFCSHVVCMEHEPFYQILPISILFSVPICYVMVGVLKTIFDLMKYNIKIDGTRMFL